MADHQTEGAGDDVLHCREKSDRCRAAPAGDLPGVIVTGEVDNVKRVVGDSALMIAPMLFGTGIKTKIVEAMSWGVPVVTNQIGIEGIDANHGEDLFVCDSDEEIVRNVLLLLNNDELNDKVSRNSVRYVASHFSSSATLKNMELILS